METLLPLFFDLVQWYRPDIMPPEENTQSTKIEDSPTASPDASQCTKVWLDGQFVDPDTASISVFDAGIQHGVGLFETMSAINGRIYHLQEHLERLEASARELRLTETLHTGPLAEAITNSLAESGLAEARIRLTLTGGNLNLLQQSRTGPIAPTIFIVVQPATKYPDGFFTRGVTAMVADARMNPFDPTAGHKTLNYWSNLQALQMAASKKCAEAIWLSVSNHVMSGSVSNLFVVKDGALLTPLARGEEPKGGIPSPVSPGITRSAVIDFAQNRNIEVRKQMLDVSAILDADELFLTNSSWGILPVVAVEASIVSEGTVGDITATLREVWLQDRTT